MGPGRLNRSNVVQAAIAFADASGIESLSMRKLGDVLGVEAMSLYNHVANKDELLDGMVDLVFAEIDLPVGGADWKTAMRRAGACPPARRCARHPWAIGLMESRTTPGPATLRHHDAVIGTPSGGGLLGRGDGPRVLGPGQLHLRVRAAGGHLALRHRGADGRGGSDDDGAGRPPRSTPTSPSSPSSTSCSPATTTATSSSSGST